MRILVSNSERHNAFQTALALAEGGDLDHLVTGSYYEPTWLRARVLAKALETLGAEDDLRRYRGRQIEGLPSTSVASILWPELIERASARVPQLHRLLAPETMAYWKNERFDHAAARRVDGVDGVHASEQCAEFQLRRARKVGATAVLDQPIIYRGLVESLERQERDRLGVPVPPRPRGYQAHIDRKGRELELAEYLFTGTAFVAQSYIDAGFPKERIFMVPYGVDAQPGHEARPPRAPGPLRILYVGQVSWWKGLSFFLDVYEGLDIEAELTVIGMLHPEWKDFFEGRFATLKRPLNYLHTVPRATMPQHLASADVLVFPSLVGGIGLVVYEAMAAGLPVLTSYGDVVIRDGIDGLVAPFGDAQAWSNALTNLSENPALGVALSEGGLARVADFSWDRYRDGVRSTWEQLSSSRSGGPPPDPSHGTTS